MPILSGLFGEIGSAVVVGLPPRFSLRAALVDKTQIYLAVAFATMSGWKRLKTALLANKHATISLIAGQNNCITEPDVLSDWIAPEFATRNIEAYLHAPTPFFHPKVLLALNKENKGFAIVGSGNLTIGGLARNIECGVYVSTQNTLGDLKTWIDTVIERGGKSIDDDVIAEYKITFDEVVRARLQGARRARQRIAQQTRPPNVTATLAGRNRFLIDARHFFRHPPAGYNDWVRRQNEMAREVTRQLNLKGSCNVSRARWDVMYEYGELGNINKLHRETILSNLPSVRRGLRILRNEGRSLELRINDVLSNQSPHRVAGWGPNIATKILCILRPDLYPVWNGAAIWTLTHYGFQCNSNANKGQFYDSYTSLVRDLADQIGVSPMRLDLFLFTVFDAHR